MINLDFYEENKTDTNDLTRIQYLIDEAKIFSFSYNFGTNTGDPLHYGFIIESDAKIMLLDLTNKASTTYNDCRDVLRYIDIHSVFNELEIVPIQFNKRVEYNNEILVSGRPEIHYNKTEYTNIKDLDDVYTCITEDGNLLLVIDKQIFFITKNGIIKACYLDKVKVKKAVFYFNLKGAKKFSILSV